MYLQKYKLYLKTLHKMKLLAICWQLSGRTPWVKFLCCSKNCACSIYTYILGGWQWWQAKAVNLSNLTYEFILHTFVYTRVHMQKTSLQQS